MYLEANQISCYKQLSGRCRLQKQMGANAKEMFAALNSDDFEKILTEKDLKNTKQSTETAEKLFKEFFREKELPENFEVGSASTPDYRLPTHKVCCHITTIIPVSVI